MNPVATSSNDPAERLQALGSQLRTLHRLILDAERQFHPPLGQLELLDRLLKDPAWAWLRPLSALAADIEHIAASKPKPTAFDLAIAAAHARDMLAGEGTEENKSFAKRYVPLIQSSAELASVHGELRQLLKQAPAESADEAERLHLRHQWAMRCKHVSSGVMQRRH